jgi:hypothetical protein
MTKSQERALLELAVLLGPSRGRMRPNRADVAHRIREIVATTVPKPARFYETRHGTLALKRRKVA